MNRAPSKSINRSTGSFVPKSCIVDVDARPVVTFVVCDKGFVIVRANEILNNSVFGIYGADGEYHCIAFVKAVVTLERIPCIAVVGRNVVSVAVYEIDV